MFEREQAAREAVERQAAEANREADQVQEQLDGAIDYRRKQRAQARELIQRIEKEPR